jgi:hypothetical protein
MGVPREGKTEHLPLPRILNLFPKALFVPNCNNLM